MNDPSTPGGMESPSPVLEYRIEGMDCADCALSLERGVGRLPGIQSVQVNFTTGLLQARGDVSPQALVERVRALGYQAVEVAASQPAPLPQRQLPLPGFIRFLLASRANRLAFSGALLILLSMLLSLTSGLPAWIIPALQIAAAGIAGTPIINRGLRALVIGRQVTIDLLMSIATLGALFIGETGEAATVILLFAIGEALEGYTSERARNALRSLLALKPVTARVLRPCLDCEEHLGQGGYTGGPCPYCGSHEVLLPVESVQVGETVMVPPGEHIPLDGTLRSGVSSVNQAPVTGESMPVLKQPGDTLYAGTLNGEGALEVEVTRPASDSTISRIVRLVEQAQSQRAPVERFIDRFAAWYTPAVVLLAASLAVLPVLLFQQPFLDTPDGTRGWLYRALALLIVACPCALVISTPVTVVSALARLARQGVLVKGGAFLDALSRTRIFAFDKTGTLTAGRPVVTRARALDCLPEAVRCDACDDMLALAASVERRSEHPLAQAILAEVETRQLQHAYPAASSVQALAGQGVQGISNGWQILVGSHALFHDRFDQCQELHPEVQAAEADGQTVMMVGRDSALMGYVSVADAPRPSSGKALQALKAIDPSIRTVMLTGDNPGVAQRVAASLGGVDEVRAGLMPEAKLEAVRQLQAGQELVAMVGDGVNDAPALAAASVGIAMGGAGTAQAMETADVVLMQDDLGKLPEAVRTSRQAQRIIKQNVAFSLAIKAAFLLLTLPGWATLWMAVFADMGASLLVTLNGMRMLKKSD